MSPTFLNFLSPNEVNAQHPLFLSQRPCTCPEWGPACAVSSSLGPPWNFCTPLFEGPSTLLNRPQPKLSSTLAAHPKTSPALPCTRRAESPAPQPAALSSALGALGRGARAEGEQRAEELTLHPPQRQRPEQTRNGGRGCVTRDSKDSGKGTREAPETKQTLLFPKRTEIPRVKPKLPAFVLPGAGRLARSQVPPHLCSMYARQSASAKDKIFLIM